MKHFLTLQDLTVDDAQYIIQRARALKNMRQEARPHASLAGKTLGMIFDKASTRTRVSFEVGMFQLGGHALFLHSSATQLGRGEPVEDSARVLSRMLDVVCIRTFAHATIERFAAASSVPVINALSDWAHPTQILADIQTYEEHRGSIKGRTIAWIGDGNNMAHSWINAAALYGFKLCIASPKHYDVDASLLAQARAKGAVIECFRSPQEAAKKADLITTDVWASMGQESEQGQRERAFAAFQVDDAVMACAHSDALFMHCLPAHRGEEVSASVIDGAQSVVWDEAENRLHIQKALLEWVLL